MAPGFKTGRRTKGTPNKPRPIILAPTEENRELLAMAAVMRTPKAVMLDAMLRFESIGLSLLAKAERLAETTASASQIAMLATEGHKFMIAAVQCAEKVAPYIHARLLAVESRGDMTEDKAPYVIRAPAVMEDSSAWQKAVGSGARRSGGIHGASGHAAISAPGAGPCTGGQACASGGQSENGPDQHDDVGATGGGETDWDAGVAGERRVAAEGLMFIRQPRRSFSRFSLWRSICGVVEL
jgi:hypothetical protein